MPSRLARAHREGVPVRSVAADGLLVAQPSVAPAVAYHTGWARTVRRFGRVAVWALPVYALAIGAVTLLRWPDPAADFAGYAGYVVTHQFRFGQAAGVAAAWFGLIGLVGLVGLLAAVRGRYPALGGLLAGTAGLVVALPVQGIAAFTEPEIGRAWLRGDRAAAVALHDRLHAAETLRIAVLVAAGLLTLCWLLVGLAVLRCSVLNTADGVLLLLAAPLVGIGGVYLGVLRTVGALLLLAGTLGLAWTAARLLPSA